MAEPLKNYFNQTFVSKLLNAWSNVIKDLDKTQKGKDKWIFEVPYI